jgi:hypothetical protein
MEPGRESRLAAELADSTKHGEKRFLRQILGLNGIFHHAEAEGIDPITVQAVEKFKSGSIALLG